MILQPFSGQLEAMLCATQLPLDDCYIALKEAASTLSRISTMLKASWLESSASRCTPKTFKSYEIGSPGRARTADPVINSHLLYRLSYRGISNG